jgi:hypothetical protein
MSRPKLVNFAVSFTAKIAKTDSKTGDKIA